MSQQLTGSAWITTQPAQCTYTAKRLRTMCSNHLPQRQLRKLNSLSNIPPALATIGVVSLLAADPALAIHAEPANALSLPTWAVHTSSVLEWTLAMTLMWRYADVSGKQSLKYLAIGMIPSLAAADCALCWHFFYNSPDLEFLVTLQASLTVVGNFTCWYGAWLIYQDAQKKTAS